MANNDRDGLPLSGTLKILFPAVILFCLILSSTAQEPADGAITGEALVEPAKVALSLPGELPTPADQIRVGFYNIEMFTDGIKDGKNRTEKMAVDQAKGASEIIDELKADILLLCEIENERIVNYINESLPSPYPRGYVAKFGTKSGRDEKMNVALLSRFEPESVEEVDFGPLKGNKRPTRGFLRVVYDLGDQHKLLIYGTHLKANWGDRNRNYGQRVSALEILKQDFSKLMSENSNTVWEVILIGDFNTDPLIKEFSDDPTMKVLEDWIDLFSEHSDISDLYTVPTRKGDPFREFPPALFDRVLVHPNVRAKPWQSSLPGVIMKGTVTEDITVLPGNGKHVSDHYPIYLDLIK